MATASELLPFLKLQVKLGKLCFGNFLTWNKRRGRFEPQGFSNRRSLIMSLLTGAYLVGTTHRMIHFLHNSERSWVHDIVSCLLYFGTLMPWLVTQLGISGADQVAAFFNGMLLMDERAGKTSRTSQKLFTKDGLKTLTNNIRDDFRKRRYGRTFAVVGNMTTLVPLVLFAIPVLSPCSMPYFLRSAFPDCQGDFSSPLNSAVLHVASIVTDVWLVYYSFSQALLQICCSFAASVTCINEYLRKTLEKPEFNLLGYRRLQILERQYNNINLYSIPVILFDAFGLSVMSLYAAIELGTQLPWYVLLVVIVVAVDAAVVAQMFIYQNACNTNTISLDLLGKWGRDDQVAKSKLKRRQLKSFPSIRVNIGSAGNYFDATTPLVVTQTTVEQTVSVLMVGKEQ